MENLNGIVVVNKEKGFTSHDVVNVIRKIFSVKKAGHTGTLDPNAEGVLPVCLGKSTRAADLISFSDKEYVARVRLGVITDTHDIWGAVLHTREVNVPAAELEKTIASFVGESMQLPPMYSAVKINGKRLYTLARKGIETERPKRKVCIYEAELLSRDGDEFTIRVKCSKGTYIRALCRDIGDVLGCGACMTALTRTASSVFTIGEARTLGEIKKSVEESGVGSVLIPTDAVFKNYKSINVTHTVKERLLNGALSRTDAPLGIYRAYDPDGVFVGIADVFDGDKGHIIKIIKAFC